jgi:hypothetical protein
LSALQGVIRRRILVNFRVDPDVIQRQLPPPFRPILLDGWALAGICAIRLEQLRPKGLPVFLGLSSENVAQRVAVTWTDVLGEQREGVYIWRRDTGALPNYLIGGRLFPGEHQRAHFRVRDEPVSLDLEIKTGGELADVRLRARPSDRLPPTSRFASVEAASRFFAAGSVGYSATRGGDHVDGLQMRAVTWRMEALEVETVHASYFADRTRFPPGSLEFDSALIMRNIENEWQMLPTLDLIGAAHRAESEQYRPPVRL